MTGYLSNLAKRTLDQPLVVRPRLASIFEPPSTGLGVTAAGLARARTIRGARPPRAPDGRASRHFELQTPVYYRIEPPPAPLQAATDQVSSTQQTLIDQDNAMSRRVEAEAANDNRETPVRRTALAIQDPRPDSLMKQRERSDSRSDRSITRPVVVPAPRDALGGFSAETAAEVKAANQPGHSLDESERSGKDEPRELTLPRGEVEVTVVPRITRVFEEPERRIAEEQAREAAPTIRITIGRVDVRAIMSGASTGAPVAKASPGQALSLNEYLQHRGGAKQ